MKIGILVREDTMMKCTGKGCLNALLQRKDAFARYNGEIELLTFTHTGGNLNRKIEKMLEAGIKSVHISSCLRAKSPEYETLTKTLSVNFTVVGYTHGSEAGVRNSSLHDIKHDIND
ncbi:CGGC domain-containing protein [Desulfosporosinus nitroreducens]|uniref:CGGC domain-containing protein n=1 Tax=Desulfosporosinus nitroreducens TaxID=2018668 RepID=A0ABT8QR28_9FIRM|nr:CGGC domain-containing protein [Desulfosporosinus nitroreducens]MCO1602961.1 CGGC domain-containing protein [Desulfosporosinus nitroreducens]MDO0823809.1 CGGC domain-containing protein [Desulfosporosinus nitroreducens]